MARSARAGAVLVALYLAMAAATTSWAPGGLRPLFDGFGSHPGQYNWVTPPREFAEGNGRPESVETTIRFDAAGSLDASMGPGDGQIAADLDPGSLAARPPDTEATVKLSPVDAGTLGPLPAGLRPEGNAYRVEIEYASGRDVETLDKSGRIGLTSAAPADTLLHSPDGKAWATLAGEPLTTGNGIIGPLPATGYYLAAARGEPREAAPASGSGSGSTVVVLVLALLVPAALAGLLLVRRRQAPPAGGRKPTGGRPRPGAAGQRGRTQSAKGKPKGKGPGQGPKPRR